MSMLMRHAFQGGGAVPKLYVDDVFSTYLYTGNSGTQTINNGIDLAGEGGLVWIKSRTSATDHALFDSERNLRNYLCTNLVDNTISLVSPIQFNPGGYAIPGGFAAINSSGQNYASWTFRRAPKFFDIVTYTGNGVAGRQIPHELGIAPGFITTKATSTTGDWNTYHRSATGDLRLNTTAAQTASRAIITAADSSTFTVSGAANTNGVQYVAYLFAHDDSEDGIIQCGSFTPSSFRADVNLGWEPQWLLFKRANTTSNWMIFDTMRGWVNGATSDASDDQFIFSNLNSAEVLGSAGMPTATGFTAHSNNDLHVYVAIRRPNKPPKSGTEVYNSVVETVANPQNINAGFPTDLSIALGRGSRSNNFVIDRLRGTTSASGRYLSTASSNAEAVVSGSGWALDNNTGIVDVGVLTGQSTVFSCFRRAPGFFDMVCYTGTGGARTVPHGLGVAPELMLVKIRSGNNAHWAVYHKDTGATYLLQLSTADAAGVNSSFNDTAPTSSVFSVGASGNVNGFSFGYVAYLFASLPGISKVGSYTGNGTTQTIDCGFTTGARFILIKRTDSTGDWYVWDSARGIVAANDPHLSLNTTAAEVTTDDSVDPAPEGFVVNQVAATNINVSGGQYIFLAVA